MRYGYSTIERWYYKCIRDGKSPVSVLRRKVRADKGSFTSLDNAAKALIEEQYKEHPSWKYQLHADNIVVALRNSGLEADALPSYATICRYMQSRGLFKQRRIRRRDSKGLQAASDRLEQRETRSFEVEYVGGLWHLDFHHCKRQQIVTREGNWVVPICLAVMDDYSRLICHVQWYLFEDTKHLVHGFSQALQRRGLPRALLTDNGSAMTSAEFTQGLHRLSVLHYTTLPYSPHQNGKQERFFATLEERLVAMLVELPSRFRHIKQVTIRYATWDLSCIHSCLFTQQFWAKKKALVS